MTGDTLSLVLLVLSLTINCGVFMRVGGLTADVKTLKERFAELAGRVTSLEKELAK